MPDAVLMPVYNESTTVEGVLDAVRAYYSGPVIVVDDGSTDGTTEVLARRADISVVRVADNCGYGCALRIGFDVARELGVGHLITMDCDGQHEPGHIPQFLEALSGGADIVSGSRYLADMGTQDEPPKDRRRINESVTSFINEATGWSLTDAFCGFKAYRMSSLARLTLKEAGYAMPLELWARAWRAGLSVAEIPVERIYCSHDRSFGEALDDPEVRLAYYRDVWTRALEDE